MKASQSLIERRLAVVANGVSRFAGDTTAVSARGSRILDADGRELIDFAGGIGVMNVGHSDPAVVAAIREQAEKLVHTCFHVATYEPYVALCEKLVEILPHGEATKVMLVNTGAEAVENAVKIARQATGRAGIICFTGAFHGRTMMSMTLTSKTAYKVGCGPFAPEVYRLPYPNYLRYGDGLSSEDFIQRELARIEEAFLNLVSAQHVAAVIIEPVLGEGGFVPAPAPYLRGLRELCDRFEILLICDEVQSGFCRTGSWGAFQQAGIVPDISTWAKSMGGGLPIGAVMGKAEVMDAARPGTLGGTYGGNPVACASSLATIQVMQERDLNRRAQQIGGIVRNRFEKLQRQCDLIVDVRGLGAMIGVEFCHHKDLRRPAADAVQQIIANCRREGVLLLVAATRANVIRVLSPLVIEDHELNHGLDVIEAAVLEVAAMEKVSS